MRSTVNAVDLEKKRRKREKMKNRRKAMSIMKKVVAAFCAVAVLSGLLSPVDVQAKTKKITLKVQTYQTDEKAIKAQRITKKGTYNIKVNKNVTRYVGYLMFKAPKAGKYKFQFSKVKDGKKLPLYGEIVGQTNTKHGDFNMAYFYTEGLTTARLYLGSETYGKWLSKRTGTIKLRKNQKLYMHFDFEPDRDIEKASNMTIQLKVK